MAIHDHPSRIPSVDDRRTTEFAIQMAWNVYDHPVIVFRKRTGTSAAILGMMTSKESSWSNDAVTDILAQFEQSVREHLVVTGGLQLTLPI